MVHNLQEHLDKQLFKSRSEVMITIKTSVLLSHSSLTDAIRGRSNDPVGGGVPPDFKERQNDCQKRLSEI